MKSIRLKPKPLWVIKAQSACRQLRIACETFEALEGGGPLASGRIVDVLVEMGNAQKELTALLLVEKVSEVVEVQDEA